MPFEHGAFVLDVTGVAATTGGALGAVLNPEGVDVIITETTFYGITNSTGAANLTVGIAADATTEATDLINALAMAAVAGKAYNGLNAAAKAELAIWESDEYLTVTGSATTVGLTGKMIIKYRHI